MRKPSITIRFGALHSSITVDGHEFDRRELGRDGVNKLSRMTTDALTQCGFIRKRGGRQAA